MAPGSELAADVFVTGRDSLVSNGSVASAGVDDVDTFHRATGAVGLALSWEGSCPREK